MDEMIRLNVGALARLTYAAAPGFVARGDGTIVNMDSSFAIRPKRSTGSTAAQKRSCWPSASRSNTNSQARACEFR
jgi:short-subunit dehydrogenase